MGEDHFTLLGRLAHAVDGFKQSQAEGALYACQASRDGRLIDPQTSTGAGIGAFFSHSGNDTQIVPVHGASSSITPAKLQPWAARFLREGSLACTYSFAENSTGKFSHHDDSQ